MAAACALAQDKVRVRYLPSYPPPDLSSEILEIEVSRIAGYRRSRELDIDQYFAAIERILAEQRITASWERVIVHAPSVHVQIEVGGKKLSLGSSYSANGLDVFADQDGTNDRHRLALESIVRLTTRRASMKSPVDPSPAVASEALGNLYAVEIKTGPAWDKAKPAHEQAYFREHSANLRKLRDHGGLLLGARYSDKGLLVLQAGSEQEARALVEQDASIRNGVFAYELHDLGVFYGGSVQPRRRRP